MNISMRLRVPPESLDDNVLRRVPPEKEQMHWLNTPTPQNPSRRLRQLLADVKRLPRRELPWVGEMVSRVARYRHIDWRTTGP